VNRIKKKDNGLSIGRWSSADSAVRSSTHPSTIIIFTSHTDGARSWRDPQVGSDDDGYAVRLSLRRFLEYCNDPDHGVVDDSPLYIFDGTFSERTGTAAMLGDYSVPPYFSEDLFRLAGERRRPPYRWFVMGPARSGSGLHIDPLATSAWNTLVQGHKRWALFPPGTPKQVGIDRDRCLGRPISSFSLCRSDMSSVLC